MFVFVPILAIRAFKRLVNISRVFHSLGIRRNLFLGAHIETEIVYSVMQGICSKKTQIRCVPNFRTLLIKQKGIQKARFVFSSDIFILQYYFQTVYVHFSRVLLYYLSGATCTDRVDRIVSALRRSLCYAVTNDACTYTRCHISYIYALITDQTHSDTNISIYHLQQNTLLFSTQQIQSCAKNNRRRGEIKQNYVYFLENRIFTHSQNTSFF